jgi:hypothetical protein
MASQFYYLILGILVVWRVTHLLYGEDGPWNLFLRLRQKLGEGFWSSLLDCFYCLSVWVALPVAFWTGQGWKQRLLLWPALSAGAIILERVSSKNERGTDVTYIEDKENDHVLRQEQKSTENNVETSHP